MKVLEGVIAEVVARDASSAGHGSSAEMTKTGGTEQHLSTQTSQGASLIRDGAMSNKRYSGCVCICGNKRVSATPLATRTREVGCESLASQTARHTRASHSLSSKSAKDRVMLSTAGGSAA